MEQPIQLYARGAYRIVAVDGRDDAPGLYGATWPGYAVIDSAGMPLRLEASYDDAKSWVHARTEEETRDESERTQPPVRPKRRRR